MINDKKPLVSILTPAWNRSAYLKKVWVGIVEQKYSKIEWIIANDGSVDDTLKVSLELQDKSKFPVTIIDSNLRVGKARMDNELMKAAKGDFIIWCDSDDCLLPGAIERLIDIWQIIPIEEQNNYVGLAALCSDKEGILQSTRPARSEIFDTTLNELSDVFHMTGDMLILLKTEKIKNSKFLEIDFMITESSLWLNFSDMKIKFIPEVMKVMDRGANNRISFSGKMEYCRGKAYSIALCEKIKPTKLGFNFKLIWKLITYHRYCIHGDIKTSNAWGLWNANIGFFYWFMLYPLGLMLSYKDLIQGKVVKTHIEYNKNKSLASIRVIQPTTKIVN